MSDNTREMLRKDSVAVSRIEVLLFHTGLAVQIGKLLLEMQINNPLV
ncbi:MAG TPA: hypothetical protein VHR86_04535 [Armatimonadota bacterium]|nr:hypothetical protein [Armatimonadota bacterium]